MDGHTEVFWTDTRRRGGERRERGGRVTVSSAHRNLHISYHVLQRGSPKETPWFLPMFKVENRSRTTRSRVLQSFALPDEAVEGHCGGNQHAQHTHTHQHILTNPPTHRPTHHHSPPLPTLPLPQRTRTRKRTCTCACIRTCTCICVCVYVHM